MVRPFINQGKPSDRKQNLMDNITHGQWSKNHYKNNDDDGVGEEYYHHHNDPFIPNNDYILDPYTMQKFLGKLLKGYQEALNHFFCVCIKYHSRVSPQMKYA
jgi:hypothetical protein